MKNSDVSALLQRHGYDVPSPDIQPLSGGYWNEVYRVRAPGVDFVLKRYVRVLESSLFPNLPMEEARALKALDGLDVGPRFVAFEAGSEAMVLVYSYLPGQLWNGTVEGVADLLLRKRAAPCEGFRRVANDGESISLAGDGFFARCRPTRLTSRFQACRRKTFPRLPEIAPVLIHTDIGAGNLIENNGRVYLIDWQCPAAGDDVEDAYSFLSPGFQILNQRRPLPPDERGGFLELLGDPALAERLAALEPAFAYRMGGYMCLRAELLEGEEPEAHERYSLAAEAELERLEGL